MGALRLSLLLLAAALACVPRPDTRPAPLTRPTLYEGRLPCEDCYLRFTRLLLEPEGTFLLQEEHRYTTMRDGDRRYEQRGRWRSVRGHAGNPCATVYRLTPEPPAPGRAFAVVQGGLRLQLLDEEDRPVEAVPPATLVLTTP